MNDSLTIGRIRPNDLTETITADFGIEVFYNDDKKIAIFYAGKSNKKVWYYKFSTVESMHYDINKTIGNIVASKTADLERKEKAKALQAVLKASDHFQIGEIIVNSWGYEQTNVDFYQVVEVLNKKIRVRELKQERVQGTEHSSMSCNVLPVKDDFYSDDILLLSIKVNKWGNNDVAICSPASYYCFRKWDGQQEYCSWYA
ncbi:MAG TPA: hypothetical protein VIK09_05015 [Candidatus Humimicrobiaceae bacterium]